MDKNLELMMQYFLGGKKLDGLTTAEKYDVLMEAAQRQNSFVDKRIGKLQNIGSIDKFDPDYGFLKDFERIGKTSDEIEEADLQKLALNIRERADVLDKMFKSQGHFNYFLNAKGELALGHDTKLSEIEKAKWKAAAYDARAKYKSTYEHLAKQPTIRKGVIWDSREEPVSVSKEKDKAIQATKEYVKLNPDIKEYDKEAAIEKLNSVKPEEALSYEVQMEKFAPFVKDPDAAPVIAGGKPEAPVDPNVLTGGATKTAAATTTGKSGAATAAATTSTASSGGGSSSSSAVGDSGYTAAQVKAIQEHAKANGYDIGDFGPNKDGIDGKWGEKTKAAFNEMVQSGAISDDGSGKLTYSSVPKAAATTPTNTPAQTPPANTPPANTPPPSNTPPPGQTTNVDKTQQKMLEEALAAAKRGDHQSMAMNIGKAMKGVAEMGVAFRELGKEDPEYVPSRHVKELIDTARKLSTQGIPERVEEGMRGDAKEALHLGLHNAKRNAGGSGGAVLGNSFQTVRGYWDALAKVEGLDQEAKARAMPLYMDAQKYAEDQYRKVFEDKLARSQAAKNAAAQMYSDASANLNSAEQFDRYYGGNSLNAIMKKVDIMSAIENEKNINAGKEGLADLIETPTATSNGESTVNAENMIDGFGNPIRDTAKNSASTFIQ